MTSAAEAIIGLYSRHADRWDALRRHAFPERRWLDRFAALLPQRGRVLDIGCGAGEPLAADLLRRGLRVTGVDASPRMIEICRERFPGEEWQVADMTRLALGRRYGGLLAWDSFFHLTREQQRDMFPRFAAHAAPGAPLMFTSGTSDGEKIGSIEGEPLFHASLAPEEYRRLLAANGFEVVDHVEQDATCGEHTIWLARYVGGGG